MLAIYYLYYYAYIDEYFLSKICIRGASAACAIPLLRVYFIKIQLFEATYKNKKTCAYSQAASCGASLARSSATCSERL